MDNMDKDPPLGNRTELQFQFDALPAELNRFVNWFRGRIAESNRREGMFSDSVKITPEAANWLLQHCNGGNRPLRMSRVAEHKAAIIAGKWKTTSQGISFSPQGALNNGQHRLRAIAEAGVDVVIYVTFNEDRGAFDVLDTGAVRGTADALHIGGRKNVTALGAAARLLSNIEAGYVTNSRTIANNEVNDFVDSHPGLEDAVAGAHAVRTKFTVSTAAVVVAYYLIKKNTRHLGKLDHFFDSLVTGANLPPKDPILVLRDGLNKKTLDVHRRDPGARSICQAASIVLAWNRSVNKRKTSHADILLQAGVKFPTVE